MITLTEQDLKELDTFIQELPVKFGLPLINFFNSKKQADKTTVEPVKKEKVKS